jgi:hypothetical protein
MVTNLQRVGIFIKAELAIAGNTFEALGISLGLEVKLDQP